MTITDATTAIECLKAVLEWVEATHFPNSEVRSPDQVESIQIIHLAATIASSESEC
jgi:hypothetical protein